MIRFEDYTKIKNNYCLCYFGQCDEYLILLDHLRPVIERHFNEMNFYIGCRDEVRPLLNPKKYILPISELKVRKKEFAHIKELKFEKDHPVDQILRESGIGRVVINSVVKEIPDTNKACIIDSHTYPTNPMNSRQIDTATKIAQKLGFNPEISRDWENSGLVVGVESPELVLAAINGKRVILADTGVGVKFYQKLFPSIEILPDTMSKI